MKISKKIKYFLTGILGALFIRILFSTIKTCEIPDEYSKILKRQGKSVIYAFWHAHLLVPVYVGRNSGVKVLISQHGDGEYIAQVIQRLGFGVARGSTTRGGAKALLSMIKNARKEKMSLGITPDGPKGPRFTAQSGAILMGQKTGFQIIPTATGFTDHWELPSWDRFCIPKPFSKAIITYGDPITIPPRLGEDEPEEYRQLLERSLIETVDKAARLVREA